MFAAKTKELDYRIKNQLTNILIMDALISYSIDTKL